jgi:acetyl esterase/lipase
MKIMVGTQSSQTQKSIQLTSHLTRRDFALRTAGLGVAMGLAPAATLAEEQQASRSTDSPALADPFSHVNPELLPALKQFPPDAGFTLETVRQVRQMSGMPLLPPPALQPAERSIPGPAGAPEVRVWIVDPAPYQKNKPVLLHIHGGGFIMPDPTLMPQIQAIATDCQCVVVSVDYRLAPETRYPGALEDNYAALKWVYAHAAELGVDPSRIAVGGASAGGGHAATLAIHARDRKEVPLIFQLLIYPELDDRTGITLSVPPAIGRFVWTVQSNRLAWNSLLGVPAGSSKVPGAAVPARVASVDGLPPAWIGVGSIDLFVEEDMEYARRLLHAGVATELLVVPGAFHGFDIVAPDAPVSRQFTASWKSALRKAFGNGNAPMLSPDIVQPAGAIQ